MTGKLLYYLFGIFRRYHKTCTSGLVMMIVGIVVFLIDYTNISQPVFSVPVKWYIKALPIFVSFLLFSISLIVIYYKSYPRRNELNFESIILRWHILNNRGDFFSSVIYSIINRSDVPITEIRGEREGFSRSIESLPVEYSLFGLSKNSSSIDFTLQPPPNSFNRKILAAGNTSTVYSFEWCANLSPALLPKQRLQIIRKLETEGTEIDAFSDNGTWAGWRIIYPTLYLEFNLIAPPRYKFRITECYCLDDTGSVDNNESKHMSKPQLIGSDSILIWKIFFPLRERRYRFKYKLVDETD